MSQRRDKEMEELRGRLEEAEQALRAIRAGEVDSVLVDGPAGPRVYTLESARSSYRVLVESMNEGAATLTRNGTVLYCNRRFADILGCPLEKVMGSALRDHVSTDQREDYEALCRRGWEGASTGELTLRKEGGAWVRVYLSCSALLEDDPVLCVVATDLTDHLRAQELQRSEAELREADRQKDEFLAMLSHELRNPLAPIRNGLFLLDRASPGSPQFDRAKEVLERQVEHLSRLVDDLLDTTRIKHGKITLRRAVVDARELVQKACADHGSEFEPRGIDLQVEVAGAGLWIDADAERISQCLRNLLLNAAKFTLPGGKVRVRASRAEHHVEVSVRDDGIGMEPEVQSRLFQRFVQEEADPTQARTGLGLGLAMVKGLMDAHGGTVRAESAGRNRGSCFVLRLPLAEAPGREPEAPAVTVAVRPLNVLVIEDNLDGAETLAEVLELQGHRAHVATDGVAGLDKALELEPDVVLCDINLPGLNGYEIARRLRTAGRLKAMRIVALSGYAQTSDRERALEAGFNDHLAKPVSVEELNAVLASKR